jgi:hypothetical protein
MVVIAPCATAGERDGGAGSFHFYFENDWFGRTDRHYTNAVKVTWISADVTEYDASQRPRWGVSLLRHLPLARKEGYERNLAISVGQNMYTPDRIDVEQLMEDDRPYAGWIYASLAFHTKDCRKLDTVEMSLGIVGPSSGAEDTQKIVHKWINSEKPEGWDNQLEDEPGVMLTWQRTWRAGRMTVGGLDFDVLPHLGATVGNVMTYGNVGGEIRVGYNLPYDFGTSLIRPGGAVTAPSRDGPCRSGAFGMHLFVMTDGRAVAQNIFLDGNTWKDSHSVDRKPFVADVAAGIAATYKGWRVSYTHVLRTEEFYGQDEPQVFGSVTVGVVF